MTLRCTGNRWAKAQNTGPNLCTCAIRYISCLQITASTVNKSRHRRGLPIHIAAVCLGIYVFWPTDHMFDTPALKKTYILVWRQFYDWCMCKESKDSVYELQNKTFDLLTWLFTICPFMTNHGLRISFSPFSGWCFEYLVWHLVVWWGTMLSKLCQCQTKVAAHMNNSKEYRRLWKTGKLMKAGFPTQYESHNQW